MCRGKIRACEDDDRGAHLKRITELLFSLNDKLARIGPDEDGQVYLEKWRTVHKLKEEYRRLTGLYPSLPPDKVSN